MYRGEHEYQITNFDFSAFFFVSRDRQTDGLTGKTSPNLIGLPILNVSHEYYRILRESRIEA